MSKDYKVTIKIQNNYMFSAMKSKGIDSAAELSRLSGVGAALVGDYLNLKRTPFNKITGEYTPSIIKISECLGVMVTDLFPEDHLYSPLEVNKAEIELDKIQVIAITHQPTPLEKIEQVDTEKAVDIVLDTLTPREQKVIKLVFGIDGKEHTLREAGEIIGVSPERVRQIESKALRKMRNPHRVKILMCENHATDIVFKR